jgi:hypothetical protein
LPFVRNFWSVEELFCFAKEDLSSLQAEVEIYTGAHGNVLEKREKGRKGDVIS